MSRIATQLAMGPWFVRDRERPFMPGFNAKILRQQVAAGKIKANTVLRGPTTNQFWMNAADAPGVSRLMGACHACRKPVDPNATSCPACKADLSLPDEIDTLGLRYVTDAQRAEAREQAAKIRAAPAAAAKKPVEPIPTDRPSTKRPTVVEPDQLRPVQATRAESESSHQAAAEEDNDLTNAFAEDVWQDDSAPRKRRKRRKGPDPLVLGMGVMLLFVLAVGSVILLTSASDDVESQAQEVEQQTPSRDGDAVSRVGPAAITAYERLNPEEVPAEFESRYAEIGRLVAQAQADEQAQRFDAAFDAYQAAAQLIAPLETDIAAWRDNELAKSDANDLRERLGEVRERTREAEAPRWSASEWQEAERQWAEADRLLAQGQFAGAIAALVEAESAYVGAQDKAVSGRIAGKASETFNAAMQAGASEQQLRQFANAQVDDMLQLSARGAAQLAAQQYTQAEQSYNRATDKLNEAQALVELARHRKYYAFQAGFHASALMLGAARGDSVDAEQQSALRQLFERLRIAPNPAAGITPGDTVDLASATGPLVNEARDKIAQQHGDDVQACYLIGFHASIIDQTLKTLALTGDQQKRIHQSLRTIEETAVQAEWDVNQLRPLVDQIRIANRRAKINDAPETTRVAWKNLIDLLSTRSNAFDLMETAASQQEPEDPELFPKQN